MTTQVDRLFNPPEWASNKDSRYADKLADFVDVSEVANKIELFSRPQKPEGDAKKERPDWKERYMGPEDEPLLEGDAWSEEDALPVEEPESRVAPVARQQEQPSLIIRPGNTAIPSGGIILPGRDPGKAPAKQHPAVDPWTIPAVSGIKVVEQGATIKMGEPTK